MRRRVGFGMRQLGVMLVSVVVAACAANGPTAPTGGSGGTGSGTTQSSGTLEVLYHGFQGKSFAASDPIRCLDVSCAVQAPAQTPRQSGTYSYTVTPGTYVIYGTITGFEVSQPQAVNVGYELFLDFNLRGPTSSGAPTYGLVWADFRLDGSAFDPRTNQSGTTCGLQFFNHALGKVLNWTYSFTVATFPSGTPLADYCG